MTTKKHPIACLIALTLAAQPTALLAAADGESLAQFQERQRKGPMSADTDNDGKVSVAEWDARGKAAVAAGKKAPQKFKRLDSDGDGFFTAAELDARAATRFAKLDADGNGLVSKEERKAGGGN